MNYFLIVPNLFSLVRFLLGLFVIINPQESSCVLLFIVIISGITDFIDGIVARKLDANTYFGAIFDPFCDYVFLLSFSYMLYIKNILTLHAFIFFWSRFIILVLYTGLFILFPIAIKKPKFRALYYGKILMGFQFVLFVIYICKYSNLMLDILHMYMLRNYFNELFYG